jgi:rubrerythrin
MPFDWFGRQARQREHKAYLASLEAIAKSQAQTAEMVMRAVEKVSDTQKAFAETQSRQIEAINTHLSLFRTTEAPTAMSMAGARGELAELEQQGFPFEGSPTAQAEWLMSHADDD